MPDHTTKNRFYRKRVTLENLSDFRVVVKETDLYIHAERNIEKEAREVVLKYRDYIETYINKNPIFVSTLKPVKITGPAPLIIREMAVAGEKAGVGPMASVAGAIAECVGKDLLSLTDKIVVENGGDIFLKLDHPVTIGIYAGKSHLSMRIGIKVICKNKPVSICTSSGTIGHSMSLGKADAVCVVSKSCFLADAAATSIGNRVHSKKDIPDAVEYGKNINDIKGIVIIKGDKIGMWGDIELVPIK